MPPFKNYYQMLEIEPFSDMETVKGAYRKLARKYHPDLNGGNKSAEERFKQINEAYDALSQPARKQQYDDSLRIILNVRASRQSNTSQTVTPTLKSGGKADKGATTKARTASESSKKETESDKPSGTADEESTPINELFETFLKRGFTSGSRKGRDSTTQAKNKPGDKTSKTYKTTAQQARGQRGEDITVETSISLLEAEQGVVKTVNIQHNEVCKRCSGTGRINGVMCIGCQGEKVQTRLKKLDVRIPPGVKEGSKVRVAGEGGRAEGQGDNGDLFLKIKITLNANLRIEGVDVHCELAITVPDAVLGAEVDVPTLNGTVKMTIPAYTPSGKVFRLKELGARNGVIRGDQFVTVRVDIPTKLTARERVLYQELAQIQQNQRNTG